MDIQVDCLALIPADMLCMMLPPILRHSVAYQIKRAVYWLAKSIRSGGGPNGDGDLPKISSLKPVHVKAGQFGFPISLLYPDNVDENDSSMRAYRKSLHDALLLPASEPLFCFGNKHYFYDDLQQLGKLINPHEAIAPRGEL
jgi:hypothetical protein